MIDRFEIRVPTVIETEADFTVEVRALDASGKLVAEDSSTVVSLTSSDSNIVFDGNGDGIYGGIGDDQKTLSQGSVRFPARDLKLGSFTLEVDDPQGKSGIQELLYSFNCIVLPYRTTENEWRDSYLTELGLKNSTRYFPEASQDPSKSTSTSQGDLQTLPVFLADSLVFKASDLSGTNNTEIETLPNSSGSIAPTQSNVTLQAVLKVGAILGQNTLEFQGNDYYDVNNSSAGGLLTSTGDFSLSFGVRLLQSGGVQTLFTQFLTSSSESNLTLKYDNGFELQCGSSGVYPLITLKSSSQNVGIPLWVAATRRDETLLLEINGELSATLTDDELRPITQTGNLIGASSSGGAYAENLTDYFISDMLEVRVLPGALEFTQRLEDFYRFQDKYTVTHTQSNSYVNSLQNSYGFDLIYSHDDTQESTLVRDFSSQGRHGFNMGAIAGQPPLNSDGGASFVYDVNAYCYIPELNLPNSPGKTFHFWISSSTPATAQRDLILFETKGSTRFQILWELGSKAGLDAGRIGLLDSSYRGFPIGVNRTGSTTLLSFVFDGPSCTLFVNGVSQGSVTCDVLDMEDCAGILGGSTQKNQKIKTLDTVMIKNQIQTISQIQAIYASGI